MITNVSTNITKVASVIITIIGFGYILYIGSFIFIPLLCALLLSTFMNPIFSYLDKYLPWGWLSIVVSFIVVILPIIITLTLFSYQIINISESLPSIESNLQTGVRQLITNVDSYIPFYDIDQDKIFNSEGQGAIKPMLFLREGVISTTSFLTSFFLTLLYTFFMLLYRQSFRNFIIFQFNPDDRSDLRDTIQKIKETIQSYITGVGTVVIILAVLNSVGLSIIGVDHAILWGIVAAFLSIVPFVGTFVGGLLPFLYTLATTDSYGTAIAVIIYYAIVQQVEGNFITPKIVGEKVDLNPLFAIISIMVLGSFWGIAGVVLALPLISIFKIVLANFEKTQPIAVLMSADVGNKANAFKRLALKRDHDGEEMEAADAQPQH